MTERSSASASEKLWSVLPRTALGLHLGRLRKEHPWRFRRWICSCVRDSDRDGCSGMIRLYSLDRICAERGAWRAGNPERTRAVRNRANPVVRICGSEVAAPTCARSGRAGSEIGTDPSRGAGQAQSSAWHRNEPEQCANRTNPNIIVSSSSWLFKRASANPNGGRRRWPEPRDRKPGAADARFRPSRQLSDPVATDLGEARVRTRSGSDGATMRKLQSQGVHHITLVGADRQTSIDFWEGVLGMPFVFEQPNLDQPAESHLYFDPGDGRLITVFTDEGAGPIRRAPRPTAARCTTSRSRCRARPSSRRCSADRERGSGTAASRTAASWI